MRNLFMRMVAVWWTLPKLFEKLHKRMVEANGWRRSQTHPSLHYPGYAIRSTPITLTLTFNLALTSTHPDPDPHLTFNLALTLTLTLTPASSTTGGGTVPFCSRTTHCCCHLARSDPRAPRA